MEYKKLYDLKLLTDAFNKVKKNNGSAGVDEQSIDEFEKNLELGLQLIMSDLKNKEYQPQPLKPSKLIRPGKRPRTLAFPTVRDRILHTAIAILLQPYFEQEFEHNSYGYRPNRSYMMAIDKVIEYRNMGYEHVFDADITAYFDNINQENLFNKLKKTAIETDLLDLIFSLLFTFQIQHSKPIFGGALGLGIPQGSPLSPLLANYYLDELDEHFINLGLKSVRYADDFVVCCKTAQQAIHAQMHTEQLLAHLNLTINFKKSQLTTFSEGFRFLGHHFIGNQVIDEKSSLLFLNEPQSTQVLELHNQQNEEFEYLQQEPLISQLHKVIEDDYDWHEFDIRNQPYDSHIKRTPLKTLYLTQIGALAGLRGNRLYISLKNEVIKTIPLNVLDSIIVFGRIQLTTDLIAYCTEHHINLIYCSATGRYRAELNQYPNFIPNIAKQVSVLQNQLKQKIYSKAILTAKFNNSAQRLKQQSRRKGLSQQQHDKINMTLALIKKSINQLTKCNSRQAFFLVEAKVAKQYFQTLAALVDSKWQFYQRNRLPPKDPINALLSLGYNLLFNNTLCLIRKNKLHPDIGFLHSSDYQPSLALDLMEPFRASIVDATVFNVINKNILTPEDFSYQAQQCKLNKAALSKFIEILEAKLCAAFTDKTTKAVIDYRKAIDLQIQLFKQSFSQVDTFKGFSQ